MSYEALTKATDTRQYHHRLLSAAVDRGDMQSAERHTVDYLAASAEEDRIERELVEGYRGRRIVQTPSDK